MAIPYEILIRGTADGKLSGSHAIDTPGGDARALTVEDLADIAPAINAAAIAQLAEVESVIAAKDAEVAGVYAYRDALLTKLEATGGDPEKVQAVAAEALGTLEDKRREAELAEAIALETKAAEIRSKYE